MVGEVDAQALVAERLQPLAMKDGVDAELWEATVVGVAKAAAFLAEAVFQTFRQAAGEP